MSCLDYIPFPADLMRRAWCLITDSGGVQEEGPSSKPILAMRDKTERAHAVDAGAVKLVGTDVDRIVSGADIASFFALQDHRSASSTTAAQAAGC